MVLSLTLVFAVIGLEAYLSTWSSLRPSSRSRSSRPLSGWGSAPASRLPQRCALRVSFTSCVSVPAAWEPRANQWLGRWSLHWPLAVHPSARSRRQSLAESVRPPTNARAHYLRGQVLLARGQLKQPPRRWSAPGCSIPMRHTREAALSDVSLNMGDPAAARQLPRNSDPDFVRRPGHLGSLRDASSWPSVSASLAEQHRSALLALGADWSVRATLISDDIRQGRPAPLLADWVVSSLEEQRCRGDLRLASGDADGALGDSLAAISRSGRDLAPVTPVLHSSAMADRLPDALLALDALCAEQPGSSAGWLAAGLLSSMIGDFEGTVVALETAQTLGVTLGDQPQEVLEKARQARTSTRSSSLNRRRCLMIL